MRNERTTGRVRQDSAEDIVDEASHFMALLQLYQVALPPQILLAHKELRELITAFNTSHQPLRRTGGLAPLRYARNEEGLRPFGPSAQEALEEKVRGSEEEEGQG